MCIVNIALAGKGLKLFNLYFTGHLVVFLVKNWRILLEQNFTGGICLHLPVAAAALDYGEDVGILLIGVAYATTSILLSFKYTLAY